MVMRSSPPGSIRRSDTRRDRDEDDRSEGEPRRQFRRGPEPVAGRLRYSLASYLRHAHPWTPPGNARLLDAVRGVAADHEDYSRQLVRLILGRRGQIEPAGFPMRYMDFNYLALEYVARLLAHHEHTIVEEVGRAAAALHFDPEAERVVEHILAGEREHLRTLVRLVRPVPCRGAAVPPARVAA